MMRRRSSSRDTPQPLDTGKSQTPTLDPIEEGSKDSFSSPPAHRTRNALKQKSDETEITVIEDATEFGRPGSQSKEVAQNIQNYRYERYEYESSTPLTATNNGGSRVSPFPSPLSHTTESFRLNQSSPSNSDKSNGSFVESVLADSARLSIDNTDHLPYRLYKQAGEYWNKYPKTDYTYSRFSKDRVELAPGQVAVPNMSRLSLNNYRLGGTYSSASSVSEDYYSQSKYLENSIADTSRNLRNRYGSSDYQTHTNTWRNEEPVYKRFTGGNYESIKSEERWRITRLLVTIWTFITTTVTTITSKIFRRNNSEYGVPAYRYSRAGGKSWNTYTTTTTTITEEINESKYKKWWILLLLLLLLLPLAYWLWADQTNHIIPVKDNSNLVITDDVIQKIALIVKESLNVEPPPPQIIERIIEEKKVLDLTILDQQRELIDKLQSEVKDLREKLNENIDIDDRIESISYKQSKDMLVQFFNLHSTYGNNPTDEDIKAWFSNSSLTREELEDRLSDMRRALLVDLEDVGENVKSEMKLLKDSVLASAAKAASAVVVSDSSCKCDEGMMIHLIQRAIAIYDADKTGKMDYALESAGGQIISTRCTESYKVRSAVYTIYSIPIWYLYITPREVITPGVVPGTCWAFQGFPGHLVIRLAVRIFVTGFTLEHTPTSQTLYNEIYSAPQNFTVLGLQEEMDQNPVVFGNYTYRNDSTPMQYFEANPSISLNNEPPGFEFVELKIESNHGNPNYTCLYRFRVHGEPVKGIR